MPFVPAAGQQPQRQDRGSALLVRRYLDFQRLLVATEAAAERHRQQLSGLSLEAEAEGRRCRLELNRLLVVRVRNRASYRSIDQTHCYTFNSPPHPQTTQFARALREQLTELSGLADFSAGACGGSGGGVSPKALQGYGFRVDALERALLARQQEVGIGVWDGMMGWDERWDGMSEWGGWSLLWLTALR